MLGKSSQLWYLQIARCYAAFAAASVGAKQTSTGRLAPHNPPKYPHIAGYSSHFHAVIGAGPKVLHLLMSRLMCVQTFWSWYLMLLRSNRIWPLWYRLASCLRTLTSLKAFEIRSFFCEKWLLSHVLGGSSSQNSSHKQACIGVLSIWPWYHHLIILRKNVRILCWSYKNVRL